MIRLALFPTPLPEELLYSVFARYASMMEYPRPRDAHLDLFGSVKSQTSREIPNRLDEFVARLPSGWTLDAQELIQSHTTLPYYQATIPPARYERATLIARGVTSTRVSPAHLVCGNTSVLYPESLQFCLACVQEDRARPNGAPAWRRVHQLPGVFVCPQHGCTLRSSIGRQVAARRTYHRFVHLSNDVIESSTPLSIPDTPSDLLVQIARDSQWLLNGGGLPEGRPRLQDALRRAAALEGLAREDFSTHQLQLKVNAIHEMLERVVGRDFLEATGCVPQVERTSQSWAVSIFRRPGTRSAESRGTHPLKVILAVAALGRDLPWLFEVGAMSEDASRCAYEQARADRQAIKPIRRAPGVRIGSSPEFEKRLRQLVANKELTRSHIGRVLGCSSKTVDQRAALLGISRQEWLEPQRRGKSARPLTLPEWRQRLMNCLTSNPHLGRRELEKRCSGAMSVLRKSDREWLERQLPPVRRSVGPGRDIDWEKRDRDATLRVRRVAAEILADPLGARLSRTLLLRRGDVSMSANALRRMPECLRVADQLAESREQFWRRRLQAAVDSLRAEGLAVARRPLRHRSRTGGGLKSPELIVAYSRILDEFLDASMVE